MKKNLVSIIILALLVVNIILTAIMLFSVTGTMKKTSALIDGISMALSLELGEDAAEAAAAESVPMENVAVYQIADEMTIPLAIGADGKDHFCMVSVSLSMNTKADGYKDYGETVGEKEDLIKGEIVSAIGSYTIEEAKADTDAIRADVLKRVQKLYGYDFIYDVVFREIFFQ